MSTTRPHLASYNYWTRGKDKLILVGALSLCQDEIKAGVRTARQKK